MNKIEIIENLFNYFSEIRYVAIYKEGELVFKQKEQTLDGSSGETDINTIPNKIFEYLSENHLELELEPNEWIESTCIQHRAKCTY